MAEGKEKTQRRVYVLPTELVERIVAYQQAIGLSSEVEAARRLLDDALRQRDTHLTITTKLMAKLKELKSLREAVRETIADHPLITNIAFGDQWVRYTLKDGMGIRAYDYGKATVYNSHDNIYDFDEYFEDIPEWASSDHPRPKPKTTQPVRTPVAGKGGYDLDDDIPF